MVNGSHHPHSTSARVLIVGDSITLGAAEVRGNDITEYARPNFVELLQVQFSQGSQRVEWQIDADTHRTTTNALETLARSIETHRPDALVFMIGGNDADLDWRRFVLSDGAVVRHRVNVDRYAKNLQAVADSCQQAGIDLIVGDVSSMNLAMRGPYLSALSGRDVSGMLTRGGGQTESDRALAIYRTALRQAAGECHFATAMFTDDFISRSAETVLSIDGVHPNAEGHRLIATALAPCIERVLANPGNARPTDKSARRTAAPAAARRSLV